MDPVAVAQGILKCAMAIKKAHDETKQLYAEIDEYMVQISLVETCIEPITSKKPDDVPQGTRTVLNALQGAMNAFSDIMQKLTAKKPNVFGMFRSKAYIEELAGHCEKLHKFCGLMNLEQTVRTQDTVASMAKGGGGGGGGSKAVTASTLLPNNSGRKFWLQHFGEETFEVPWEKFIEALNDDLGEQDEADIEALRLDLDENSDGTITLYEYSNFCENGGLYEAYEAITNPGFTILGWGTGNGGELGTGDCKDIEAPIIVPDLPNEEIVQCALGNQYSLFLYRSGQVLGCGLAGWGQMGCGDTTALPRNEKNYSCVKRPQPIEALRPDKEKNIHVSMLAAGFSFALALTKSQQVYAFGCCTNGQCAPTLQAFGEMDRFRSPTEIEFLSGKKVSQIEAGSYLAAALTEEGDLYCWGFSEILGIGTPEEVAKKYEEARTVQSKDDAKRALIITPTLVEDLKGKDVSGIAMGQWHLACLTTRGEVYSFGSGLNGRLGHGKLYDDTHRRCYHPKRVEFPEPDVKIIQVACGSFHTVLLQDNGTLWTMGYNAEGQCCGTEKEYWTPYKVVLVKDVKIMSAAERMTACLTNKGQVLVFGKGPTGGSAGEILRTATPIRSLNDAYNVKSIYCGTYHAVAVSQPKKKKGVSAGGVDPMIRKLVYQLMERVDDCIYKVNQLQNAVSDVEKLRKQVGESGQGVAGGKSAAVAAVFTSKFETVKSDIVADLSSRLDQAGAKNKQTQGEECCLQ